MATITDQPNLRARAREWMRPPRELTMTAAGKFLCLLTLGVGFGAINTGNNLLFLLLGMMLSVILASGALSEAVLRKVSARRRLPQRLVAGTSSPGEYIVENEKRYASLSIEVADRQAEALAGPLRGRTIGRPSIPWWKVWKKDPTELPVGSAYSMRVEGHETTPLEARWEFAFRGRYRLPELSLVTRFPFGLFEKRRMIRSAAEVVVFPAGSDASDWISSVFSAFGEVPSNNRGAGDEFFGLREYRDGEDRRQIHWKSSARRGALVVRENEAMQQCEVEVVLCNWGNATPASFERAVSKTVGLVGALAERGWRVGLRTSDACVEVGIGAAHLDRLLSELAVVDLQRNIPVASSEEPNLARIAIGSSDALTSLPVRAEVLFPIHSQGGERV